MEKMEHPPIVEVIPKSFPTNLLKKDWSKRKCFIFMGTQEFQDAISDFFVRDSDVWVVTLAKCGTTWMQELTWLVMNNYNFEKALSLDLEKRSPFLEFKFMITNDATNALFDVLTVESPRLIKSHLPLPMLPQQLWTKKPKTIYVFRNPKDMVVSFYYHMRSVGQNMNDSLNDFVNFYVDFMSHTEAPFEHVTEFYALRNEPWIYYTSFERMKLNLRGTIEDICKFLNKPITEEQMQRMLKHLSFEEMKNNPTTQHHAEFGRIRKLFGSSYEKNNFVRKGEVGSYKQELTAESIVKLDQWIERELARHHVTLNELLLLDNKD